MEFHLILPDCALGKQETKEHFRLVDTPELGCERKGDQVAFTEAKYGEK